MKTKERLLLVSLAAMTCWSPVSAEEEVGTLRLPADAKLLLHQPIAPATKADASHQFIVALEARGTGPQELAMELRESYRLEVLEAWSRNLVGLLVETDLATARDLARDPRVRFVEQDLAIEMPAPAEQPLKSGKGSDGPPLCFFDQGTFRLDPYPSSMPTIPWAAGCPDDPSCTGNWGIDRIDDRLARDGTYQPVAGPHLVDAFILDIGVQLGHQELSQTPASQTLIGSGPFPLEEHGQHVAGILAGKNFGVAQSGIRFHSMHLGTDLRLSNIVSGFEEVASRKIAGVPAVVSMSINSVGFPASLAVSQVVRKLIADGILVVNSAGNVRYSSSAPVSCQDVLQNPIHSADNHSLAGPSYPPEVLIVGAMDDQDRIYCECGDLSFATYDCASRPGSIDLYAPGVDIVSMSAHDDQAICRLSGTSMAAPHAAGAAALLFSRFPDASPGAIQRGLRRMSTKGELTDHQGSPLSHNRLLYVGPYASDRPVAGRQYLYGQAGETLSIPKSTLIADDFDWQGRPLQVVEVRSAWNGQLVDRGASVDFTIDPGVAPSNNVFRSASFRYVISNGVATDIAAVHIVVLPTPGADEVVFGGSGPIDIDLAGLLENDDVEGDAACLAPLTSQTAGTVTRRTSGGECVGYRYQPPHNGFSGTDSFDYVLSLAYGGQVTGRVTIRYNHPAFPTPIDGSAVTNYPGSLSFGHVVVPGGAYVMSWPTSQHTGITEYRLNETLLSTQQTSLIYRGHRTFFALSGRSNGFRSYTVQACTPQACSAPSPLEAGFGGLPSSTVKTELSPCSPASVCNPRQGLWYAPTRSGDGVDLQRDDSGRWRMVFFTYRADTSPIWYRATPAVLSGSKLLAVLEEERASGGPGEQFGFLELDLANSHNGALKIYRFQNLSVGQTGLENLIFQGDYHFLAGQNQGATGQWRPANGNNWGLLVSQLPTTSNGSTTAHSTVYFFRPDGTPTWVSTASGSSIAVPFMRYQGTTSMLYRRGINLCLQCTGTTSWSDSLLGSVSIDIQAPLTASTGQVLLNIPVGSGVDPGFPSGYSFSYAGGLIKVTD